MDNETVESPTPTVPKSLLEKHTGCQVLSLLTEAGSKPGDNYMGMVYSVTAEVVPPQRTEKEKRHYIIKCYPSHPTRQVFLSKANIFHKEIQFYTILVKELTEFQKDILEERKLIPLAFPECQGGETIDYEKHPEEISNACEPLDNFIMMTDLKKTFGYEMREKKVGLDLDHVVLVVKELAKLHALSWAYQKHSGIDLLEKFPFMKNPFTQEDLDMWARVIDSNLDMAIKTLDSALGKGNKYTKSTQDYKMIKEKLVGIFMERDDKSEKELWEAHRNPPKEMVEATNAEEPWRVVCHGDAWTNNMVFKYDDSREPKSVILLDFQVSRLSCPTADLVYTMYSSTTSEIRKNHLETILQQYHDKFFEVCKALKVEPLPGFSMETLKRKYRCSLPVGYTTAICMIPMQTKEEKEVNLEDVDANTNMDDMFIEALKTDGSAIYTERIVKLSEELYDLGVI